jgi:hypothetical protein
MVGPKLQILNASDPRERHAMSRREFVRVATLTGAAIAAGGLSTACEGGTPSPDASTPDAPEPIFDLPTLGGAPDTDQGRTVAAFCDTVVPGRHRDPMDAVGAIDTGAPGFFFDPALPALAYVGVLSSFLDSRGNRTFGVRRFWALTPEQRDETVAGALSDLPLLAFAVQLAKLAYFASPEAGEHLGYPGANEGYRTDANFSFGRAMSMEITSDGNLP